MSELTRNTSGRAVLVALAIGLVGAIMATAILPADAAEVVGSPVGRVSGDACETLGFPGESFAFDVPKGSANDQTRVFDETYGLEDGASVGIFLPSNRSYMDFDMTGAWASAVVVFGRNNQGEGTLYDYSGESFVQSDDELTSLSTGNIKSVTLCYDTKASPSISTSATPTAVKLDPISDVATLEGAYEPVEGKVTFAVYKDDDNCTSPDWTSQPVAVTDGSAELPDDDLFTPTESGTYYWVARFDGDDNNHPVKGECGDAAEISIVFDGGLACDDSAPPEKGGAGDSATEVGVSRLVDKDDVCEPTTPTVLYNLDIDSTSVLFDPDLSTHGNALFLVRIDWAPTDDPFDPKTRMISLSGDPRDLEAIVACASLVQDEFEGVPVNPDPDPEDTIQRPVDTPWCLAGQRQELLPSGQWQQIQWYHGGGDPRFQ